MVKFSIDASFMGIIALRAEIFNISSKLEFICKRELRPCGLTKFLKPSVQSNHNLDGNWTILDHIIKFFLGHPVVSKYCMPQETERWSGYSSTDGLLRIKRLISLSFVPRTEAKMLGKWKSCKFVISLLKNFLHHVLRILSLPFTWEE